MFDDYIGQPIYFHHIGFDIVLTLLMLLLFQSNVGIGETNGRNNCEQW